MYSVASDDDMVECPYNKYHRMTRKRLQPHLIKCRLSYPDVELCKCPFNASHLIPEPEFTHHVTNCPDKALITQYKYNIVPLKIDEEDRKQVEVDCDENWDETEVEDYDPKKYAMQANVIRAHIGDLPSTRREFRKSERKRLGDEYSSDDEDTKGGKKGFKDFDCKKEEEERETKWYEDLGAGSSSRSNGHRRQSYKESLKEWSKDRGLDNRDDHRKRAIKLEKTDGEERSKKKREEEYHLDEDPYYRSNSSRSQHSPGGRESYHRHYQGSFRKHHY